MQLVAIAAASALVVGGGLLAWAPWDDGFEWEGLACEGTPLAFDGTLDGRIRFHIENRGIAAPGTLCIYDDDRVLRWSQEVELRKGQVFQLDVPVPREPLASRALFGLSGEGSASSGQYTDVADCRGGISIVSMYFEFTDHGVASGSLDEPSSNCDMPWTSWFDQGQPDPRDREPTTLGQGAEAPLEERTDARGWYIGFGVAGAAGGVVWLARTKVAWMLFTRLRRSELLDQKVRAQIHELVGVEPGIHASGIARTLELAQGQVHYHLAVLVRDGLLRRLGGPVRRRYFVAGSMSPVDMERIAILRSTPVASLFEAVRARPGANVSDLAEHLDWSVPRVSRFLAQMERTGLIERRHEGRFVKVYPRHVPMTASAVSIPG